MLLVAITWKWSNSWSNRVHAYSLQRYPITKRQRRNAKRMKRDSTDAPSICTVSDRRRKIFRDFVGFSACLARLIWEIVSNQSWKTEITITQLTHSAYILLIKHRVPRRHSRETWHTEQWRSVRRIRLRFAATGRIELRCERSIDNIA